MRSLELELITLALAVILFVVVAVLMIAGSVQINEIVAQLEGIR